MRKSTSGNTEHCPSRHDFSTQMDNSLYYHTPNAPDDGNRLIIGYHFDDGIYGPLYFEYGRPEDPEDRTIVGRAVEQAMLKNAPETVLVLLKASAEAIRTRMKADRHPRGVLQDTDVEHVLGRFDDEYKRSLIKNKMTLDTTAASPEETMAEFVTKIEPSLTEVDRSRIMMHRAWLRAG